MRILLIILLLTAQAANSQQLILGILTNNTAEGSTLRSRMGDVQGTLKLQASYDFEGGSNGAVLESSIVPETNGVKIFYTATKTDQHHTISVATAANIEDAWTKHGSSLIGKGVVTTRNASSSCVLKVNGFYYAWCLDGYGFTGDSREVYLYKSSDGYTWTDMGKVFSKNTASDIYGYGNTTIYPSPVGGTYYGVVDVATASNIWVPHLITATNIEGPWTVGQRLTSLSVVNGSMYCGGVLKRTPDGTWHYFYHYGMQGNLPTSLAYATSTDGVNWTVKEAGFLTYYDADPTPPTPPTPANFPYAVTDQIADVWIEEMNGKTYILAEFVENTSPIKSQIRMWTYNGTFEQMVSNLNELQ